MDMNREPIDITAVDKYDLIAALCNGTDVIGLGSMDPMSGETITRQHIIDYLEQQPDREILSFDYLFGRPLKVALVPQDGKLLLDCWWLYDRDSGPGRALEIVKALS
jgi:hypothetical protein